MKNDVDETVLVGGAAGVTVADNDYGSTPEW